MRIAVFILALLGALACGGLGWKYKSDERNSEEARQIRQIDRELDRAGQDEPFLRAMRDELNDHHRWVLWLCYAMLAALPLGMLGGLLALHRKGWLAGLVLLLAAAGPLVCAWQLSSLARDPWVMAVPTGPLALAGLLSFFVRARPAARREEKPATAPAPVAAAPSDLLSAACPTCASTLKYAPMPRPRSVRCPRCKTVISVPAAQPVEVTQMVEPEPEVAPPEPKRPRKRSTSPVATILGWVLAVGGTTAFSVLAALDIVSLVPAEPDVDRPLTRGPRIEAGPLDPWGGDAPVPPRRRPTDPERTGDKVPENAPPDPEPDAKEEARWTAQYAQKMRDLQARERPIIEAIQKLPPKEAHWDWGGATAPILYKFGPHKDTVRHVLFAPDGETLVSADGHEVKVWDLRTGKERHTLAVPGEERIHDIALSPDNRVLASAETGAVRLWDVRTGASRHVLTTDDKEWFPTLTFDRDGRLLAGASTGRDQGEIRVWDVNTGRPAGTRHSTNCHVDHLTRSPRGEFLAFGDGGRNTVVLCDEQTARLRRGIKIGEYAQALAFSPDGRTLAVATESRDPTAVKLYEVRTGKFLRALDGPSKPRKHLAFHPDGATLVTASGTRLDGTFTVWDATTGKPKWTFEKGNGTFGLTGVAFSPGGTLLALCTGKGINLYLAEDLLDERTAPALEAVQRFAEVSRVGSGLHLEATEPIGDQEMAKVKAVPRLTGLRLMVDSEITDAGLAHLAGMPDLEQLILTSKKPITDAGLAHLKTLKRLTVLSLEDLEGVTDAGVAQLGGLTGLTGLRLRKVPVTDAGVAHLKGLAALKWIDLSDNKISDAALAHLAGLKKLESINLLRTSVTPEGVQKLKEALPDASISAD